MTKSYKAKNGTIEFDYKVLNQDVYATPMTRGDFKKITGSAPDGDASDAGFAFLMREETEVRWSSNPTGQHHRF